MTNKTASLKDRLHAVEVLKSLNKTYTGHDIARAIGFAKPESGAVSKWTGGHALPSTPFCNKILAFIAKPITEQAAIFDTVIKSKPPRQKTNHTPAKGFISSGILNAKLDEVNAKLDKLLIVWGTQ